MMDKKSMIKKMAGAREVSLLIVLMILCGVIWFLSPSFLTVKSILDMLKNNTVIMIMALGMLCVLLIGGIDISITSTLALSGMTVGMLLKYNIVHNTLFLFVIAIALGALCGGVAGFVITRGNVLPIIATLGFMYIYRGFAYLIAKSQWASADNLGDFKNFALEKQLGLGLLNNVIVIVILCYLFFFWVMKWTKTGRKIYAVGSNPHAAEISGIRIQQIKMLVYIMMGMLSGLCGALAVAVYSSAQPNMLYGKEMDVIAACVIGGVSMSGGKGSVTGVLLGSLILAVTAKALPLIGIDSIMQNTAKGIIILAVIVFNVIANRMMNRKRLQERGL
jgi:rhamnose transport system permease protein